jgi:spore coat polysaccharide biosynthesis protein SpsF (cytidylyltransferase family)
MQCENSMDRKTFRVEILHSDSLKDHKECYNNVQDNIIHVFSYFKKRGGKFKISVSEPVEQFSRNKVHVNFMPLKDT